MEDIAITCSIQHSKYITISVTPVLSNQIYVRIKKPPANRGFEGSKAYSLGEDKVGPVDLLWKIYLVRFGNCVLNGNPPKKAIMFVKKLEHLIDVHEFLHSYLGILM